MTKGGFYQCIVYPHPLHTHTHPAYIKVKNILYLGKIHTLVVHLFDAGFLKYGFDQRGGRSFVDIMNQIYFNTGGRVCFFFPCKPTSPYVDRQLQEVGTYDGTGLLPGGPRHLARSTNTSGYNDIYIQSLYIFFLNTAI